MPLPLIGSRVAVFKLEGEVVKPIASRTISEAPSVYSAEFSFSNLEPGVYLIAGWRDANGNGVLEAGDAFGVYVTPEGSVTLEPPVSNADFDLETLETSLRSRLEVLGVPVGLEEVLARVVAGN